MVKLLGMSREDVREAIKNGDVTIAVYGLGKMGLPLAAVFADNGAKVIGVDINERVVNSVNNGENHIKEEPGLDELVKKNVEAGRLKATTDGILAAKKADVMIILVPTLADDRGNLKLESVYDVAEKISKGLEKGDIVITEATMPPGTTESLIPILEKSGLKLGDFGLAHAPERTMTGTAIRDITGQYPKIVGASDERTLEAVIGIYETINRKGVIPMSSIKAAEAVKVFEGIYRDVNIALANELALWCEEHGLDAIEIFNAANTQPYCHLHMPGAGVGGHCIPIYPWFVINLAKKTNVRLIRTAREINDSMPRHVVELTVRALNDAGKPMKGSKILVLGLTFRGGVKEFTKSPAIDVIRELKEWGAEVYAYDPLCTREDAERFGAKWKEDFKDVDAIVIVTDHREFKTLDLKEIAAEVRTKVIVDGRNVIHPEEAKKLGFIYKGVGRV
ncbi:nucleotide sugar dehydrogenase [Pyrococcus abyssi]|uniref:UDP-N-acetyl-D-mannosamine dehydrogenase n=1 Tax=Pyrococcus abyssi (strain GE5 / Orsay) TaxID=272844 RepID=Q9UZI2_PYRAB|nr:nucleotide sugar dehydrogenase [Pyrococcus abyssi]CAB50075.1 GDP-mannose or UDP-glucose6-dehydrogenase [Pyrococcus abyssi GE5]CCE70581.1 TPA: udp-n-acetyl-d-mannosaminuronic acid dehydrogenase [Pyrococcus abyssi GE5]